MTYEEDRYGITRSIKLYELGIIDKPVWYDIMNSCVVFSDENESDKGIIVYRDKLHKCVCFTYNNKSGNLGVEYYLWLEFSYKMSIFSIDVTYVLGPYINHFYGLSNIIVYPNR